VFGEEGNDKLVAGRRRRRDHRQSRSDRIEGGEGNDTIVALGGADFIDVKDGSRDDIVCGDSIGEGGEGADTIEADPGDTVIPGNC
jgi:Ca2+-binding RTX toxin-like protein